MKVTAKCLDTEKVVTRFERSPGGYPEPVEADAKREIWEVQFETEISDTLTDFPLYDMALGMAEEAIERAGGGVDGYAEVEYRLESGGYWGIMVFKMSIVLH